MSSKSALPTNPQQGRGLLHHLCNQQGGFSPFMFGMVVGITIFSAVSLHVAQQELLTMQAQKQERAKKQAKEMADALDFAILSETKDTYREDYNLERARSFSQASANTRGGEEILVTTQETDRESFGENAKQVAFATTDDLITRNRLKKATSAGALAEEAATSNTALAVYDTSEARDRQIRTSNRNMESLAEQIYAYYAAKLKFPTESEYQQILESFPLGDAWGEAFDYTSSADGQNAELSFTTPWNYTRTLNLNLKDGPESAK